MKFLLRWLLKIVSLGLVSVVTMFIGLGLYALTLLPGLPNIEEIRRTPLNIPLRIYNSDNELIAEYGNERRIPVRLDDIPALLIDAVLVTEDDRFYHHTGVDFPGILRAGWSNLRSQSHTQGASTITMQVARNFFLTPERTYTRKLKEILLAFNMERALTKDEILELYFNKIFLGHRAYGFGAASRVYYGVALRDLSVPEIAMLAGLPKAPSRDNPISNPERAAERRDYVLKRLHELKRIDDFSYDNARLAPITATRRVGEVEARAPYAAEMARRLMVERFGERVYELGYEVTLTIDGEYQAQADLALRKGLLDYDRRHGFRGPPARIDPADLAPETAAAALREFPRSRELMPAVVLESGERSLTALTQDQQTIRIEWEQIKWARPYKGPNSIGPEPATAAQVAGRGDVVYVSPTGGGTDDDTPDDPNENHWRLGQLPEVSGALVSLDPGSGAILALTGGFDYYLSKFNRATQAQRQPGSNIKPFIYSAALDNGFTPGSLVSAGPIVVEDDLEGIWRPQNYSQKFFGPTRLRKALSLSLNLVSVRLVRAIGIDATVEHLAKFGFDPGKLPRSLSLALGSLAVTPLDMAAGFAVFANGGKRVTPYLIERIVDADGNEIDPYPAECADCPAEIAGRDDPGEADAADPADAGETTAQAAEISSEESPPVENPPGGENQNPQNPLDANRAISEQNAFLVNSLMQQVILSGTGRRALALNRGDLAGKTGTTNDFRDAWFSGFNRDIVTTVFVGFDEPSHLGRRESGASAALPIWVEYMGAVLDDFPEQPLTPPAGITAGFINKDTGKLTLPDDPNGYFEYYMAGTEPDNRVESSPAAQTPADDTPSTAGALF